MMLQMYSLFRMYTNNVFHNYFISEEYLFFFLIKIVDLQHDLYQIHIQYMTLILNHQDIQFRIRRIAYQIYETHIDQDEIILAGIDGNGYKFAECLQFWLAKISSINIVLCKVSINKKNPLNSVIKSSLIAEEFQNKAVVLVDDVLNSGLTLMYGVRHFLSVPIKRLTTAVLVNRNHKRFPVKADFKGISLSTSLQEHIEVDFSEGNYMAFLK